MQTETRDLHGALRPEHLKLLGPIALFGESEFLGIFP